MASQTTTWWKSMANTLAPIDQASFLGWDALGRILMIQILWVYDIPITTKELEEFRVRLNRTLLGRRVRRSTLLLGRHSWVRASDPALIVKHSTKVMHDQINNWADQLQNSNINPERGPGWQLDYTELSCGGSALLLTAPHCLVDLKAVLQAVTDSVNRVTRIADLPAKPTHFQWGLWRHDLQEVILALIELAQSLPTLLQICLSAQLPSIAKTRHSGSASTDTSKAPHYVHVPQLCINIPREEWKQLFESLDGDSSTLLAAITARLAVSIGRTDPFGAISMVFPVSTRVEGDTRANALKALRFSYIPESARSSLKHLRKRLRGELLTMLRQEKQYRALLSCTPFVPRAVVRRIESLIIGCSSTITINNFKALSGSSCMPTGIKSRHILIRSVEKLTSTELIRWGGILSAATWSVNEHQYLAFRAWQFGAVETQQDLADAINSVMREFSLKTIFVP